MKKVSISILLLMALLILSLPIPITNASGWREEFIDTQKLVLARKYASWSDTYGSSFTVYNVKPYLTPSTFNAKFTYNVQWDELAVASAFIPAVAEVYKIYDTSNPNNYIIWKKPTLYGLSAIFRGSEYEYYWPDGTYILEKYMINNGSLYISIQIRRITYTYSKTIFSTVYNEQEWKTTAWVQARAGISAEFQLMDFVNAGLNLAEVSAGVQAQITSVRRTTYGYIVTVSFSIEVYEITVNYHAKASVTRYYHVDGPGENCPLSRPMSTKDIQGLEPLGCSYDGVDVRTLNAIGTYKAYTKTISIEAKTLYDEFSGNGSTGMIVFTY